ncbi:hypothetical protein CONPUDRAFT_76494 [Coniophora puteana RWD-64-598 SS2]|uniref:Uncharacterized protein n=1 Tax=Coniophora puteana (strain RWD-64-598) TaxID=741705 RepID=A0A5M3MDN4_CONPW|nr:uncharacterized protein CONPUDRAFT_76494 [Coniophora puteana RWD-64-598 SS2]EIW76954.1 hypothetical protein CONPUDRAFT_76494 [Coniophora puteana RWD-64-598 SS2]
MSIPRLVNEDTLWRSHFNRECQRLLKDFPFLLEGIFNPCERDIVKDAVIEVLKNPCLHWLRDLEDCWPVDAMLKRIVSKRSSVLAHVLQRRRGEHMEQVRHKQVRFDCASHSRIHGCFTNDDGEDEVERGEDASDLASDATSERPCSDTSAKPDHQAVLAFLRSCPGNLGALLPNFLESGIVNRHKVSMLLSLPAAEREHWLDKRREALGMSHLEVAALQAKCNQEQSRVATRHLWVDLP